MKIRIIRTPFVFPVKHLSSITSVPDIGTAYVNGAVIAAGHESEIIDAAGEGLGTYTRIAGTNLKFSGLNADEIIERIPLDVDVIGLQSMHSNRWIYDSVIVRKILKLFPNTPLILGGESVSAISDYILPRYPEIYACVIGEGEETFLELIDSVRTGRPRKDIEGIAFMSSSGAIKFTERRKRKKDLDKLSRPSWKGVPIKKYLDNHCGVNSFSRRSIPMVATRGCPFSCTFCTVPNMWESKWFARPPADVVDEIEGYIKTHGVNHIDFVDLTIMINRKWMEEFCNMLIERDLDLTWAIPIGTRTEGLDDELLALMKKSGLMRVLYSAESGSDETLERINKKLSVEGFNKVVRSSVKQGIIVKIAFIFGFPGQTFTEVYDSLKLITKMAWLGAYDIVCLSFIPYPKTELFDQENVEYDYEDPDNNIRINNDIGNMKSWSDHFGDKFLRRIVVVFSMYFYLLQAFFRPHRVFAGFYRAFIKKKPLTNFESIAFNFMKDLKTKNKVMHLDEEDIYLLDSSSQKKVQVGK